MQKKLTIPLDGIKGLAQNWKKDLVSGLIVSLLKSGNQTLNSKSLLYCIHLSCKSLV